MIDQVAQNSTPKWTDTQEVLKDAFARQSLCGLHIDLQVRFHEALTESAFKNAFALGKILRQQSVPNFWVALVTSITQPTISKDFQENLKTPDIDKLQQKTPDNEIILPKKRCNLIHPKPIEDYYDALDYLTLEQEKDTSLVTGVNETVCVSETIIMAFKTAAKRNRPFKMIVVEGAINHTMPVEDFIAIQKRHIPEERQDDLMHISQQEICDALAPVQK